MKPKNGRPTAVNPRDQLLAIRLTTGELDAVRAEAERLSLSASAYARTTLMEKVKRGRQR